MIVKVVVCQVGVAFGFFGDGGPFYFLLNIVEECVVFVIKDFILEDL